MNNFTKNTKAVLLLLLTTLCCISNINSQQLPTKKPIKHSVKQKYKPQRAIAKQKGGDDDEGSEKYDGIEAAQKHEFMLTHDPVTNTIPKDRLLAALAQRKQLLLNTNFPSGISGVTSTISTLSWTERGSNSDSYGLYGNPRDNNAATSGRIAALWNDLDATKPNQVFIGGIDGGLWSCPDITLSSPAWTFIDNFSNLAISSICQDPTNVNTMYFGTGEKTYNADGVRGGGVWKSTDHGVTWAPLASTTTFYNVSKILCDKFGNVYVGAINWFGGATSTGLQRSVDGGTTWANITPTVGTLTSTNVSDMVYDPVNDKMHVYMGYYPSSTTKVGYCFGTPSTVTSTTWTQATTGSGMAIANAGAGSTSLMVALAVKNGVVWALRANNANWVLYRSIDGGVTWTLQQTLTEPGTTTYGVAQGWYSIGIDCDPSSAANATNNIVFGGLNMFKSTNGGTTVNQVSEWVTGNYVGQTQYVHADVHNVYFGASRILACSDGGVFYSGNAGTNWSDRNTGLRIKQFYSCAINPASPNYFLAGAQDNGVHQFTQAGLGSSTEVNGGDGCFVSIDQLNPANQVGSYIYNNYHISTDNGTHWSSNTFGSNAGQFVNPFDFDSKTKKMYAAYTSGKYLRWDDPTTTQTTSAIVSVTGLSQIITALTVSPNLNNVIYIGAPGSKLIKVTNANTATPTFTTITPPTSTGVISCIAVGPSATDQDLVVTSASYGTQKVFISSNGGATWTDITGTSASKLPDMPVRWALFYPGSNTQILLATEAGVWYTTLSNGTATIWQPSAGFPAVRTDMIKYSDATATIAVATHGRGLWTTKLNTTPKVCFTSGLLNVSKTTVGTTTTGCRTYKDYQVNMTISDPPTGTATATLAPQSGATAIQGVDYDFTTNENFVAPSAIVNFNNGVYPNTIPVTFRIYNNSNNTAPQPQVAIMAFVISGATNAVTSTVNGIYTLNLSDIIKPIIPATTPATAQTIWTENWEVNATNYSNWVFAPDIYHTNVPNANGFVPFYTGCANNINTTTAELLGTDATGTLANANCGNFVGGASTAMLYRAVNAGGENAAQNLSVTFNYISAGGANGITNSLVYSTDGGVTWIVIASYGTAATTTSVTTTLPALLNNTNFLLGWRYTSTAATPANTIGFAVDDIVLKGDIITTPIEIVVNATGSMYHTSGQAIDYYSGSNNIMATITNPTQDLGCVTTTVENAGTTWQAFQGGLRSQKTFLITPSLNIATAGYNTTLFFTNAELSGNTPSTLKIAKTTAASFATANSGNTVLVTPTNVTYSTLGVAFTGAFTGFSRFALVNSAVVLPIVLTNFRGTLVNNTGLLNWTTTSEINSKDFDIEKSIDGINFNKIGTLTAGSNSSVTRNYNFTDTKLYPLNYYRLRINDVNGKNTLSDVVLIKYNPSNQSITVLNNPFSNEIDIRLAKMPLDKMIVEIFDQKGSKVYSNTFSASLNVNISGISNLAAGAYFITTTLDGIAFTNKVVKK